MRIGVFCSGGDAPGMNACVRAVVRSALASGHEVVGIRNGYQGLLDADFHCEAGSGSTLMSHRSVAQIVQFGGTILRTSRCADFRTAEGLERARRVLAEHEIDALVPIGGDGTLRGAIELSRVWKGQIIGCPGTIDNDLIGTDYTIGFSTAVRTAVEAVDKLRDTAESHSRMFLIEVMGRESGYLAVFTAIAGGAEVVCIPETSDDVDDIIRQLTALRDRGKGSIMMVVAEGDESGGAEELRARLESAGCPFSLRTVILGHLQRGGSPTPEDRILASRLGDFAVRSLLEGATGALAGIVGGRCTLTPLNEAVGSHKPIDEEFLNLIQALSK